MSESAEERAKATVESIMRTMTQFGSPRPIPPEYWFAEHIQAAHDAGRRAGLEERDREWRVACVSALDDPEWNGGPEDIGAAIGAAAQGVADTASRAVFEKVVVLAETKRNESGALAKSLKNRRDRVGADAWRHKRNAYAALVIDIRALADGEREKGEDCGDG